MSDAVVTGATSVLAHAPGLARHGSKPSRELPGAPDVERRFLASLRGFDEAVAYPPHQAFVGRIHPRDLPARPWVGASLPGAERTAPAGEIIPEQELLGLLALVDGFELVTLDAGVADDAAARLAAHPLTKGFDLDAVTASAGDAEQVAAERGALPLHLRDGSLAGAIRTAHEGDESLAAPVLLENLANKATGLLALVNLLDRTGADPHGVDYVIGCGEEAVGDRYQRGGGNLAKAIAEQAGLSGASGADVKNFCAAPIPALVMAASLVQAGVVGTVAVVAGGSLPKLGMKFQGHLDHDLPVLEDVIGGTAALVTADDGRSPRVRLDAVGRHAVGAGSSNPQIVTSLGVEPLERVGLSMTDVDDYGTELHNPEITEPQGSGDVATRNYRTLAALAAQRGEIAREAIDAFTAERGMPGFAPTQGHLASALCYLPHVMDRLTAGDARRALLLAKGSLFLGRMSHGSDGMSVLLERNPGGSS